MDNNYTGWKKWIPTQEEAGKFYLDDVHELPFEMKENEYLIVYDNDHTATYYCYENGKLRNFHGGSIVTSCDAIPETPVLEELPTKTKGKQAKERQVAKYKRKSQNIIHPRNDEQACAFDMIKDPDKTIKLLTGGFGTGKTMILVAAALEALDHNQFDQIVWIRNNIDVKDTKDLGALPGEVIDKLLPYLGPFIDHAGENHVRTMITKGTLKVEPLQYLRGRNFTNTLILCSEAENLTKEHFQLIIARAAEGSQVWFDGDCRQRDKVAFEKSKGLETMIERLAGDELFGYVHLTKSERSATASRADKLN